MKKIIRFLAKISGVEMEIRRDERKEVAMNMHSDTYWWTGGSLGDSKWEIFNAFGLYSENLKKYGTGCIEKVREEVYATGNKKHNQVQ